MPVYGGITWSDTERTRDFLKNKCYYIGAGENRAEYVRQLYRVQMGDILYLEQKRGNTTEVMAIGFVVSNKFERIRIGGRDMGFGRYVQWVRDFADEP